MITGELKSKVDRVWDAFWSGGISNGLTVIEQITYLLFVRRLDELHTAREKKANLLKKPIEEPIFLETDAEQQLRWSRFKDLGQPEKMYELFRDKVFPFIKETLPNRQSSGNEGAYARFMKDAVFVIPTPSLFARVVDMLNDIPMDDRDTKGDLYEYLLSKIASAGTNGQFRTPRHIIKLMVDLMQPKPDDIVNDPACGTCGFLVETGEYLRREHPEIFHDEKKKAHFNNKLFCGTDFDASMLRIGAMNMVLHGVENPRIDRVDALSESGKNIREVYTLILANPPFTGSLNYDEVSSDILTVTKTKKTELLFLALFLKQLKAGGRCAVIVPDGVLFGSSKALANWYTPTPPKQLNLVITDTQSMRRRRMLRSRRMYDMCFRAMQGLPLPARSLTTFLIESIMARLITTEQIIICNYVWMANHLHMQLYSLDASALNSFHGQLKKRLTDFLKRLLGLSSLRLWDDRTTLGEVLDLEAAIDRIVYTFLNPVRAKLVRSIDDYKGLHTWHEFLSAKACVNACIEKEVPWVLATDIEALNHRNPSNSEERSVISELTEKTSLRETHTLRIYPFKWLEAFGITDPKEIEDIRLRIIQRVRQEEAVLAPKNSPPQRVEGFVVTEEYKPPRKSRKVFMYASTLARRLSHLELYQWFINRCRYCYQLMRQGACDIPWPPGCFVPPGPLLCNAL